MIDMQEQGDGPEADGRSFTRRNALKAGVGIGVGAVAWSGASITSLGGTPAYAAVCTNFIVNETASDRNTNQGGGANCSPFRYQDDSGISFPSNAYSWNWVVQMCPGEQVTFNFPADSYCVVTVWVYRSGTPFTSGIPNQVVASTGPSTTFMLPKPAGNPPWGDNNWSNARFAVRVQCVAADQKDCFTS